MQAAVEGFGVGQHGKTSSMYYLQRTLKVHRGTKNRGGTRASSMNI